MIGTTDHRKNETLLGFTLPFIVSTR